MSSSISSLTLSPLRQILWIAIPTSPVRYFRPFV
jgi:hypothetical protein